MEKGTNTMMMTVTIYKSGRAKDYEVLTQAQETFLSRGHSRGNLKPLSGDRNSDLSSCLSLFESSRQLHM